MIKVNTKLAAAAMLSAALLAGCGGGDGGGGVGVGVGGGGSTQTQTIASNSVVAFIQQLFTADENSDPIDINSLTLASDDTVEPSAI